MLCLHFDLHMTEVGDFGRILGFETVTIQSVSPRASNKAPSRRHVPTANDTWESPCGADWRLRTGLELLWVSWFRFATSPVNGDGNAEG